MYKLFLVTQSFMDEFLPQDVESLIQIKPKQLEEGLFQIEFKEEKEFVEKTYDLIHFSRTIEFLFLELEEFENKPNLNLDLFKKEATFSLNVFDDSIKEKQRKEIENEISSDILTPTSEEESDFQLELFQTDKIHLVLNLFGDELTRRDYQVNAYDDSLSPLLVNYALYKIKADEEERLLLTDPLAELGDIVIESALFNPRKPLFVKEKRNLPIAKLFKVPLGIPKTPKENNKIIGIVQDNDTFKYIKENVNFSSQKVKLSLYDLDWLDVKFHQGDTNFVITQMPECEDEEEFEEIEKELCYQAEFISKKEICIFSHEELTKKYLEKYKLEVKHEEVLEIEGEEIFFYIIR